MIEAKIINFLENEAYTIRGLFGGFVIISFAFVPLSLLFKEIFGQNWYYIYFSSLFVWLIIWLFIKFNLPKTKKNKVGLCFLIYSEKKVDEFKLKRDFVNHLKKKLDEQGLLDLVMFMEVRNHFSKKIQEIDREEEKIKTIKKWNEKMQAHFLIWGSMKRRKDEGGKLFLELDSMIYHVPIPTGISIGFRREMLSVFPREINFLEKFELKGFYMSAELISLATQYIVGTAAFLSGDPFLALKLHNSFLTILNKSKKLPPNLEFIKERTIKMISGEFSTISGYYYYKEKDLERMFKFANKALEFDIENYTAYLLLAIYHFLKDRNTGESLRMIRLASKCANGDLGWKYSEAFLYCYSGDLERAKTCYRIAFRGEVLESEFFLKNIISFIEDIIKEEPDKFQLYFALGTIYYRKLNNPPKALENYEKFLEAHSKNPKFSKTAESVKGYIEDVKEILKKGWRPA